MCQILHIFTYLKGKFLKNVGYFLLNAKIIITDEICRT